MLDPICIMNCEDCGKFAIIDPNAITLFKINKEIFAIARCSHCDRVKIDYGVTIEVVQHLSKFDVKLFDWNTGQRIKLKEIK